MTVENRKLFANRDARRRLSEMGGIMASSPELLGEAQMYADGGRVIPGSRQEYIINVPGLTQPGEFLRVSEDTLMMLNNAVPGLMSQRNTLVETADSIGNMVDSRPGDALIGTRLQRLAPTTGDVRDPTSPSIGDQIGSSLRNFFQPIGQSMRDTMQPIGQGMRDTMQPMGQEVREGLASSYSIGPVEATMNALNDPTPAAPVPAVEELPVGGRNLDADMGIGYDPMMTPTVARVVSDQAAGINRNPKAPAAPPLPTTAEEAYAAIVANAPKEDVAGEVISNKMDADAAANQTDLLAVLEATANDPETDPETRVKKTTDEFLGRVGVDEPEKLSTTDRIKAYESMFKEMLGEGDEDAQKEIWHNMAMIGFAIAAGESPRALQNIANGLLAGTKMMKEDRSARKDREDKIKTLAITEGMREARAAQDRLNDLEVAKIRSSGSGTKRINNPINPLNQLSEWASNYYKQNFREPTQKERESYLNTILPDYSLSQIEEGAPQLLERWKSIAGPETGDIEDGMRYIGPSYNRTAAQDEKNWEKVE